MYYLNMSSKKNKISVRVVLNTFTGNSTEYDHSNEMMRILNLKNIKISDVFDINQELVFEKEKSI